MKRVASLDIFRGYTLAAMVLVNNPGNWSHVFSPLKHASWHGVTPTDLVYPFFMFVVGAAMFFSLQSVVDKGGPIPWVKIFKRTALLFVIGIFLNASPFTESMDQWRIMGVLQRIALAYGICAVLVCVLDLKKICILSAGLLLLYWWLLNLSDDPYSLRGNIVLALDIYILGASHMYNGFGLPFEPEGILSTLPSVVTVFFGYLTSLMLVKLSSELKQMAGLFILAAAGIGLGLIWSIWFPINKPLWTSSYVLFCGGASWLMLAIVIYLSKHRVFAPLSKFGEVYGSNPLLIYILSQLFSDLMGLISWSDSNGATITIKNYIHTYLASYVSPASASLIYALAVVCGFYLLSLLLYKRRIYVKL